MHLDLKSAEDKAKLFCQVLQRILANRRKLTVSEFWIVLIKVIQYHNGTRWVRLGRRRKESVNSKNYASCCSCWSFILHFHSLFAQTNSDRGWHMSAKHNLQALFKVHLKACQPFNERYWWNLCWLWVRLKNQDYFTFWWVAPLTLVKGWRGCKHLHLRTFSTQFPPTQIDFSNLEITARAIRWISNRHKKVFNDAKNSIKIQLFPALLTRRKSVFSSAIFSVNLKHLTASSKR